MIHESLRGDLHLCVGPLEIPSVNYPRKMGSNLWGILRETDSYHASNDASLFSTSLPVLPHEKCMSAFYFSPQDIMDPYL